MECVEAFTAREWAHIHMCARRFTISELCGMEDISRERGDHDAAARYRWAIAIRAIDGGEEE